MINWLIVRAILREEDLGQWDVQDVLEHYGVCHEHGLFTGSHVVTDLDGKIVQVVYATSTKLSGTGLDFAALLADKERLENALDHLDSQGIEPTLFQLGAALS